MPETKLFGYHEGNQLVEELKELKNAIALGDPAKVLVLRESVFRLYDIRPDRLSPLGAEHIDILEQLAEERGLVGSSEVAENINELRPEEGKVQSLEDLNQLVFKLQDAFTTPQLQKYINTFEGKLESKSPAEWRNDNHHSPIRRITPWRPGISANEKEFDNDPLRGYVYVSHTSKQRVILHLLRECWRLELPELVDGIGQFEIQVRKDALEHFLG